MRDLRYEISGILNVALGMILFLSLISYNPFDPSFSTYSSTVLKISNWCGTVGSYSADMLIQWLGIGAFIIPVLFFILAALLFKKVRLRRILMRGAGILFALISSVGILSIYSGYVTLFGVDFYLSGLAGYVVGKKLVESVFGGVGGTIVLFSLLVIFLIVSTGMTTEDVKKTVYKKREKRKKVREKIKKDASSRRSSKREPFPVEEFSSQGEITVLRGSDKVGDDAKEISLSGPETFSDFRLPPLDLLDEPPDDRVVPKEELLRENAVALLHEMKQFGVDGEITSVMAGPRVTLYEFKPAPGEKLNKIVKLSEDLALAMKAESLRIIKNLPGRGVMGIEVPNRNRERVYIKEILGSREYLNSRPALSISVGLDILGRPVIADLSRMPHLLIAGTTGSGKSVALNSMILSLLFRTTPEELRMILVDPKMLEFIPFDGVPNLLHPVVTQPKDAARVLRWAVAEMEGRYRLMMENGVRNIDSYNSMIRKRKKGKKSVEESEAHILPYIVIVIDELSDLMMSSAREVEESVTRLSQMARASGIHMVVATQRPSVDVVTGIIKANFPYRISFKVSSRYDSYTILGQYGAEILLGHGDMLFMKPGPEGLLRAHGPFVSEVEIKKVVSFLKRQGKGEYEDVVLEGELESEAASGNGYDEKYEDAVRIVVETQKASISFLQRRLGIGFNRAARLIERMEEEGLVSPAGPGGRQREVRTGKK